MDSKILLDRLESYGADMKGIYDRFLGDAELYERCFCGLLEERNFKLLEERIEAHEYEGAFQSAHAIKGLIANLGLTPFYEKIHVLVEALRANDYSNIDEQYAEVRAAFEKLKRLSGEEEPETEEEAPPVKPPEPRKEEKAHSSFIDSRLFIPTVALLTFLAIISVIFLFVRLLSSY